MRRFPLLRRLTAVVAQLLLVQLAFAGAAGACPLDGHGATHDGMHMSGGASPGDGHHAVEAVTASVHPPASPASHQEIATHCDMPCAAASCATAGHCIANAAFVSGDADALLGWEQSGAPIRGDFAPHSVSTTPEPPPPRA